MRCQIRGQGDDRIVVTGDVEVTFTDEYQAYGDGVHVATAHGELIHLELDSAGAWRARVLACGLAGRATVHRAPDGDEFVELIGPPLAWVAVIDEHHVTPPETAQRAAPPRPLAGARALHTPRDLGMTRRA